MFARKILSRTCPVLFALAFTLMLAGPAGAVSASFAKTVEAANPHSARLSGGTTVTAVSAGYYHTCELRSDGTIQCWGSDASGQATVPSPNSGWVQVSAGANHTCAWKSDGIDNTIRCWGRNVEGQAPDSPAGKDWMHVSTGAAHTCAIESDSYLYCWGDSGSGQTAVPPGGTWEEQKFSAGGWHTCGIKADGTLACWGSPSYGQTTVPTPNSGWTQVSAGRHHTCAIKSGGTVQCWGAGTTMAEPPDYINYGQSISPTTGTFTQLSAGGYHTCGLKSDGTLQCWGRNDGGQATVPTPNSGWTRVSAGELYTCGLKTDGTLRCWGYSAPIVAIAPSSLPDGALDAAYTTNITVSGGTAPYTLSLVSGAVPTGLTLNADGTWSGSATAEGTFNFTVQANDVNDVASRRAYTLRIDSTPPTVVSITCTDPNPTVSTNVNFTVTFSEPVTGVSTDDFVLVPTGLVGPSVLGVTTVSQSVYEIPISTGTGTGKIRMDLVDDNSILDVVSLPLGGAALGDGDFTGAGIYTIVTPKRIFSTGAQDGWILESAENSGIGGGTPNSTAATLRLGDDAARKQYRSILSFSTGSVLPDTAIITKVTLKIYRQGVIGGGNPVTAFQGFMVDIKNGVFGTSALQVTDFQALASKSYGPFIPSLAGNLYIINLTSGKAYINRLGTNGGLTQMRLRFKVDDNNNGIANYLSLHSGSANVLYRPWLEVQYYMP